LFDSPGDLHIEDVIADTPGPREVLVEVRATGLCHSDMHFLYNPVPLSGPTVLGHEGAGVVVATGSGVTYVSKGDHVVASPRAFCGACEWCLSGHATLCAQAGLRRTNEDPPRIQLLDGRPCTQLAGLGTFSQLMLVHENALVRIADDIPFDRAALLGCGVITGVGAVLRTARVRPGANVAVIGCGGIGLNCIQGAGLASANKIIAIDVDDRKLELARRFGATDTVNSRTEDVHNRLDALLPGADGVDYSFEALGSRETYELAFAVLRPHGTATVIGLLEGSFQLPGRPFLGERRIQGSMLGSVEFRRDIPFFLDLYRSGRLKLDELISSRLALGDINEGFRALRDGDVARSVVMFEE
jgi:S-(hydroxymethyl)glutathione dehydrogenase/alcohol dehydrogenase